jgi:hypothetical protein
MPKYGGFAHKKRGYENIIHFWQHDKTAADFFPLSKPSCNQK